MVSTPPTMMTFPLGSSVAVCPKRGMAMLPVVVLLKPEPLCQVDPASAKLHHIPVLAVTAHAMVTDQQRVIQAGCDACISKPVDFKSLSRQLELWLNHAPQSPSGV